jgi:hypothetical protein
MPVRLVIVVALGIWAPAMPALSETVAAKVAACREITEADDRLVCYDALTVTKIEWEFSGKGNSITPQFEVTAPRQLYFYSDDVVMVLYLLDERGDVLRNLHRGGTGAGTYLIETPGRYAVQVNASGGWVVRVEFP